MAMPTDRESRSMPVGFIAKYGLDLYKMTGYELVSLKFSPFSRYRLFERESFTGSVAEGYTLVYEVPRYIRSLLRSTKRFDISASLVIDSTSVKQADYKKIDRLI
jgi:hypothetical protein